MKWSGRTAYSIGSGEWIICRTVHSGRDMFTLFRQNEAVSRHDTAAAAKQAAKEQGQ